MVKAPDQNGKASQSRPRATSPLRWRRADAMIALLNSRFRATLRLDSWGWRWLRERGLTRGEARQALGDLLENRAIVVEEEAGVLVVRATDGEGGA